jgi:hypothetical protein
VNKYDAAYIEAFGSDHNAIYATLSIPQISSEEANKNRLLLSGKLSTGGKKTKKRHNRRKRKNTYRRK